MQFFHKSYFHEIWTLKNQNYLSPKSFMDKILYFKVKITKIRCSAK